MAPEFNMQQMKSVSIYNNNEAGLGANATIEYRNTLYGFSFLGAGAGMPVDLPACVLAVGNMAILALLPKTDAAPATKKIQRKFAMYYSPSNG